MREKYKDTVSYIVDGVDIQLDKEYGNKGTVLGISGVVQWRSFGNSELLGIL